MTAEQELRAELDKLWNRIENIDVKLGKIETSMAVADASRAITAAQMVDLATEIKAINRSLAEISIAIAGARGGARVANWIATGAAGLIGWASQFLHISPR